MAMTDKRSTVPIVDFSGFRDGSSSNEQRAAVGESIFHAMRDVGFVYLTNHGIPKSTIAQAFAFVRPPTSPPLSPPPL